MILSKSTLGETSVSLSCLLRQDILFISLSFKSFSLHCICIVPTCFGGFFTAFGDALTVLYALVQGFRPKMHPVILEQVEVLHYTCNAIAFRMQSKSNTFAFFQPQFAPVLVQVFDNAPIRANSRKSVNAHQLDNFRVVPCIIIVLKIEYIFHCCEN